MAGAIAVAAVMMIALSACSLFEEEEPGPVTTEIPDVPADGVDLVCGMDRADLEVATGLAVGRVEDDLRVADGAGQGQCTIWPAEESLVNGPLLWVTLYPTASSEGQEARDRLDGNGHRPPDVALEAEDGGVWGEVRANEGRMSSGVVSIVFVGDTVVQFTTNRGGVERNPTADIRALTKQVAASYGLKSPAQ